MDKDGSEAATAHAAGRRPKVFISYAREDKEFRERLAAELEKPSRPGESDKPAPVDAWGDWKLAAGPKFRPQLERLVRECDAFVFLLSPESAASEWCKEEVDWAAEWGKRIIPVLLREGFDPAALHSELRQNQWALDCAAGRLGECAAKIASAVHTDFELLETHTSLLQDVEQWKQDAERPARLLSRHPLEKAEAWLTRVRAGGPGRRPQATPDIERFIGASQQRRRRQKRVKTASVLLLALAAVGAAGYYYYYYRWLPGSAAAVRLLNVPGLALQIEEHEVTQSRYRKCVAAGRCSNPADRPQPDMPLPVTEVTAVQASEFCRWIGRRLPTSCEWLRAATRGCTTRWPWGDDPPSTVRAKLLGEEGDWWNAMPSTSAAREGHEGVAQDLIGNVREWTRTYSRLRADWDGVQVPPLDKLVIKGGGYKTKVAEVDAPEHFSLKGLDSELHAARYAETANDLGFRCVAPAGGYEPERCGALLAAAAPGGKCLP